MNTKQLRCWDNGGETFDRYTILPPRGTAGRDLWRKGKKVATVFEGVGASQNPFHPQGFGQLVEAAPGEHLGKRIKFEALPGDVQKFAQQYFDIKEN